MTAGYMGRLIWIVFFGKANSDAASSAHEVKAVMSVLDRFESFYYICGAKRTLAFRIRNLIVSDDRYIIFPIIKKFISGYLSWVH